MTKKLEDVALLLMAALLVLLAWQDWAGAQDQKPIDVPFLIQERAAMLEMCEAAKFGYAAQFTPVCPLLKRKFEEAEKAAAQKTEPKQPTPCAPNECPTKPLTKD